MKRGDFVWGAVIVLVMGLFVFPATHGVLMSWTKSSPLAMGFAKFAVLASMGELLSLRMRERDWIKPIGFGWRVLVWGILGALIALMFQVFSAGAQAVMSLGLLPGKGTAIQALATAFWTSTLMNVTFGPCMMCAHRISDAYIELSGGHILTRRVRYDDLISHVNWHSFFCFVIGTTVPLVWIPAHTATFMAPPEYRVLIAAFLSIVFGALLAYGAKIGSKHKLETLAGDVGTVESVNNFGA
jgi:hypothetical protein